MKLIRPGFVAATGESHRIGKRKGPDPRDY